MSPPLGFDRPTPGALGLILRDRRLWLLALGMATALVFFAAWPNEKPVPDPLSLASSARGKALKDQDPALYAVFAGTFPGINDKITVGEAFARYQWFSDAPKWTSLPPGSGASVLVVAPLTPDKSAARLGLGSAQARLLLSVEFALSADAKRFAPRRCGVEVRDASNSVIMRTEDRDFRLLRQVLRNQEPSVALSLILEPR
ncbi:hypothetical protein JCM15519_36680 [Fundidesulfovibrio butyratiphilus]